MEEINKGATKNDDLLTEPPKVKGKRGKGGPHTSSLLAAKTDATNEPPPGVDKNDRKKPLDKYTKVYCVFHEALDMERGTA